MMKPLTALVILPSEWQGRYRPLFGIMTLLPLVVGPSAQGQSGSPRTTGGSSLLTDSPSRPGAASTAEEILSALQRTRPANEVILSESLLARPTTAPRRPLLPEGFRVLNQIGRIAPDGAGWVLQVEEDPVLPPIRLLFNRTLEQMVRTTTGANTPVRFTISGELTVFRGENFLLPRVAARCNAPSASLPGTPSVESVPLPARAATDDVLARLRAEQPEHEVLSGASLDEKRLPSNSFQGDDRQPDGMPLAQRPGRVWGKADQWTFTFESAADHSADQPLRLLPSQHLERMISAVESSTMPLIFIVSGEITVFDGTSYLLVRAVARRASGGALGK